MQHRGVAHPIAPRLVRRILNGQGGLRVRGPERALSDDMVSWLREHIQEATYQQRGAGQCGATVDRRCRAPGEVGINGRCRTAAEGIEVQRATGQRQRIHVERRLDIGYTGHDHQIGTQPGETRATA